jgi:phosphoribosylanthranilate isomerase
MFVKICGITNREDALAAVEAGARALGFIFCARSPRYVTPASVAEWIGEVPAEIWKVGVYVDEAPENIERTGAQLGLDVAQLHGRETPASHPRGVRVWKAIRVAAGTQRIADYPAEAILLDGPGGGATFDWSLAGTVSKPMILAGGLTPENVQSAIERTNPWGVDTASGVELSPGRKDHARMKLFIKAALINS